MRVVFEGTKTLKVSNVLSLLSAHVNSDIFIFMCFHHQSLNLTHASFNWRGGKMLIWWQKLMIFQFMQLSQSKQDKLEAKLDLLPSHQNQAN
jgi:hypothetical protein